MVVSLSLCSQNIQPAPWLLAGHPWKTPSVVTSASCPSFSSSFLWVDAPWVPAEASEALSARNGQARAVGMPTGHPPP